MEITVNINLEKGTLLRWNLGKLDEDFFSRISEICIIGKEVFYKTDNPLDYGNNCFRTEKSLMEDYELVIMVE